MSKRFHARGLRLAFADRTYGDMPDDPKPACCPHGHGDVDRAAGNCRPCQALRRWQDRQYRRDRRAGISRTVTDVTVTRQHVERLRAGGMTVQEMARRARCGVSTVRKLLTNSYDVHFITTDVDQRLLAIPVPDRTFVLTPNRDGRTRQIVTAVGVQRRIQAACLNGYSLRTQADKLGYALPTVRSWLRQTAVSVTTAMAVDHLYPALIATPGHDLAAVSYAESRHWLAARYFCDDNIDDPGYRPLRALDSPIGVRRRLRALAWMGHGPQQVAAVVDEKTETVRDWTIGGATFPDGTQLPQTKVPAYARHLTDIAFETLSGRFGPDQDAATEARDLGWAPPLAWYDIDIDDHRSRPACDIPSRDSKNNYPLQSQILHALWGKATAADLIHPEKKQVVRILHHAGWSDRRIGVWLRWSDTVNKCGDGVLQFRLRENIHGGPRERQAWFSPVADLDFIVTPAA